MTMTTISIQQKPKEPLWTQRFIILNFSFMSLSCGFQMLLPTLPLRASTLTHQTLILGLLVSILSASAALIRPFVGARLQNSWPDRMNLLGWPSVWPLRAAISLNRPLGCWS
ncbi:hypothetical protein B5M42_020565 [Paenibacillus athensensis]|uniref:Uncharacterized protein n=1 Tax=Paenibacillus athensensis TaxID=1967502 RepID=A0A4Y8PQN1_9BACL|nr:hypothetical protein [Paenibacillus athensensis]MCD1261196.1 hypothetical protein [Paenibacillus athensensis]